MIAVNPPPQAAILVFTIILGTLSDRLKVLPPLKPNQPNQSMNAPKTAIGRL
jgi:hypothetical protein